MSHTYVQYYHTNHKLTSPISFVMLLDGSSRCHLSYPLIMPTPHDCYTTAERRLKTFKNMATPHRGGPKHKFSLHVKKPKKTPRCLEGGSVNGVEWRFQERSAVGGVESHQFSMA